MECPLCKSENTQRLSIIYQSGTQQINTTSRTYGGGGGSGFGIGGAATTTSGTAQSYLASKAAPPPKKSYKWIPLIILAAIVVGIFAESVLLGGIIAGIAAFLGYKSFKYNKEVHPGMRAIWLKSWHCNKCGTIYTE
jgi:hypothetical protein